MISVVLATYNEEKNLARCLESIQALADEIIVVDGESTDQTSNIARSFKAKVITTSNKPNFHINKQMAMDAATGQLVLQLDADEVVDKKLAAFITNLDKQLGGSKNGSLTYAAWWLKRKNLFLNKWLTKGGQYPDPVIRLYINGQAHLPQKDVHEQMKVEGEVGWAEGHLLHYSNPHFSDYMRKFNTYTSFKAQQLAEEKLSLSVLNSINYLVIKPTVTFLSLFIRHKGFIDGFPGLMFALFSGLHHPVAYLKRWEISITQQKDR